jgi:cellulose synthase/poly-beta-1,6-N-acetylglucosamine synthase-like glycosyltransferase
MKRLGWKALGYAFWLFGMIQLVAIPLYMMNQPNTVEFNLGVLLLIVTLISSIFALYKLIGVGKEYVEYLESKEQE